jgi:6-phosphogluconolactonase
VERELRVVDDLPRAALDAFREAAPLSVALAGGTTPLPFYELLAVEAAAYPWHEVNVLFGDERCVPPDHPDSNYRMAFTTLLSRVDARVHRMPGESCDAEAYEDTLVRVFGPSAPRIDLVLLGLGEDGHTASLFLGDPAVEETKRLVVRVERPDHPRLTLTVPVLSAAGLVLFLVAGEAKREALRRLMEGDRGIPAARVEAARVVVLADRGAAGG